MGAATALLSSYRSLLRALLVRGWKDLEFAFRPGADQRSPPGMVSLVAD